MINSRRIYLVQLLMRLLPPTRCFALKRGLLRWCGATIGTNTRIVSSVRFQLTGALVIGNNTWIGHEVLIVGGDADVLIGAKVDVGPRVMIVTGSHEYSVASDRAAGRGFSSPTTIQDGAWLGARSTILGGVTIGRCSIVAAGALVNADVQPATLVGGVPARVLKLLEGAVRS